MLTIKLSIIKHSHRKRFVYNHNLMKYTSITDFQKKFCVFMKHSCFDSKNFGISLVYSNHTYW